MADGGCGANEDMGYAGGNRGRGRGNDEGRPVQLDIGLGDGQNLPPRTAHSNDWPQPPGEGGCFSLRQFLRESEHSRQPGEGTLTPGTPPSSPRLDMASALPDFVQDHLVMEQSYLGSSASGGSFRLDNLPHLAALQRDGDFAVRGDIPFDLMASNSPLHHQQVPPNEPSGDGLGPQPPPDVQGASKGLPDFLSDGPIRREAPQQKNSLQIENERLQSENERLRVEFDMLRQQLSQQIQRNKSLELEINRQMSREQANASTGAGGSQNAEVLEDELYQMTKRALNAENKVSKLKEYIDKLKAQIDQKERAHMMSAASTSACQTQSERLASQLRNAANTAEVSLRQLLNGVDNLRYLANSLEPNDVITSKIVNSDSEEDVDSDLPSRPGRHHR